VLTGGFGRGEGSIRVEEQNTIKLMKDFDLVVIVNEIPSKEVQETLLSRVYDHLDIQNAENNEFRFSRFVVDIKFLRKNDLAFPDIWFYDLKSASKILYGEEISGYIPYRAQDIPLSSCFRILFEKVTGLLGHFSYDYLEGRQIDKDKHDSLIYECLKTYIEIGTVLCILTNNYRPSYLERCRVLKTIFAEDLKELASEIPELPAIIEKATMFKLKPSSLVIDMDSLELWFSTRDHLGTVIKYFMEKYLDANIYDWSDLSALKGSLSKKYYVPMLQSWMKQRLGAFATKFVNPMNKLFNILLNLEYIYQLQVHLHRLYLKPLRRPISPSLKFFLAAPLVLFSIDRKGHLKSEYLNLFSDELSFCIPMDHGSYDNVWERARHHYLKAYRLYSGYHLIK
jgi:hypothetical protein